MFHFAENRVKKIIYYGKKTLKCLLIFILTIISLLLLIIFIQLTTFDGATYTKKDLIYYVVITPSFFHTLPHLSDEISYGTAGDDNYGYSFDSITWNNIDNVTKASKKLEQYFVKNNYQLYSGGRVWNAYWAKSCTDSEQYSIVWGDHSISIELISVSRY